MLLSKSILFILSSSITLFAALAPQYNYQDEFSYAYSAWHKQKVAPEKLQVKVLKLSKTTSEPCCSKNDDPRCKSDKASSYHAEVLVESVIHQTNESYKTGDTVVIGYDIEHPSECGIVGPAIYNVMELEEGKSYDVYLYYDEEDKLFKSAAGIYGFMNSGEVLKVDCNQLLHAYDIFASGYKHKGHKDVPYKAYGYNRYLQDMTGILFYYEGDVLHCNETLQMFYHIDNPPKFYDILAIEREVNGTITIPFVLNIDQNNAEIEEIQVSIEHKRLSTKHYTIGRKEYNEKKCTDVYECNGRNRLEYIERELKPLTFEFNEVDISENMLSRIQKIAKLLNTEARKYSVKLIGNCDEVGSEENNYFLGLERAYTVRKKLIELGVSPERLSVESYGESDPVCTEQSVSCRAKNRRVEFRLY